MPHLCLLVRILFFRICGTPDIPFNLCTVHPSGLWCVHQACCTAAGVRFPLVPPCLNLPSSTLHCLQDLSTLYFQRSSFFQWLTTITNKEKITAGRAEANCVCKVLLPNGRLAKSRDTAIQGVQCVTKQKSQMMPIPCTGPKQNGMVACKIHKNQSM